MEHRVLYVDDEPAMINAVKRALHKEPYELLTAESAEAALNLLAETPVDIVISDEQMPGMGGSDFLAIVRRKCPDTVQMLLTGHADLHLAIRAINVGEIYRLITKPFDPVELAIAIRQAIQHKSLIVESRRLLRKVRQQTAILQRLAENNPDILEGAVDGDGSFVVDEGDGNLESLIQSMRTANDPPAASNRAGGATRRTA